ncbi:MAG: hypothetical protein ACT4PV_12195 [Planctomycetaceae bacterium]
MRRALAFWTLLGLLAGGGLAAEEGETHERIACRAIEKGTADGVLVDRGAEQGVARGDRAFLFPREGGTFAGEVIEVSARNAVIRLHDASLRPEAGTRGEILVRLAEPEEAPPAAEEGKGGGEPEPVPPAPEEPAPWTPDQPLLAGVKPLRPEERARRTSVRLFVVGALAGGSDGDSTDSFLRLGAEVGVENPFGRGGLFRFQGELDALTEREGESGVELLVPRLSYRWGGNRYEPVRWEVGRFLQNGMPEFGVLDGGEWGRRLDNGHRVGASLGFMPEPDDDFSTFSDFQLAGFYEFVSGPREDLVLTGGFQKSFHNGSADRDLIVAKARWRIREGWDLFGAVWVDFHGAGDGGRGSGVEITQAFATLSRRGERGDGFDLSFHHFMFPAIDRVGEFPPVSPTKRLESLHDRLALDAWRWVHADLRLRGHLSAFSDETEDGGAVEFGIEWHEVLFEKSRATLTGFAALGEFEETYGARGTFGVTRRDSYFDLLYEIGHHHQKNFPNELDDLIQHRLRASGSVPFPGGWELSVYGEGVLYDDEFSWTFGFHLQRRF